MKERVEKEASDTGGLRWLPLTGEISSTLMTRSGRSQSLHEHLSTWPQINCRFMAHFECSSQSRRTAGPIKRDIALERSLPFVLQLMALQQGSGRDFETLEGGVAWCFEQF